MVVFPPSIIPVTGRLGRAADAESLALILCLSLSNRFRGVTGRLSASLFDIRVIDFIRFFCSQAVEVLIARTRQTRLSPATTRIVLKEISYVAS